MKWINVLVGSVVVAITASVVAGLFIVGSPKAERLARFDERRANDLQMIQSEVTSYWQQKNRLPQSLEELQYDLGYFIPPTDPQTGAPYEYRVLAPLRFELCTVFSAASEEAFPNGGRVAMPKPAGAPFVEADNGWTHGVGRMCFTRTIDPERFPKPTR